MDDRDLARLLSGRNEPSVLEKEAMFEQIMRDVRPQRRRARWIWAAPALACAAAAMLVLWPRAGRDEFAARGGAERQPTLRVVCVGTGSATECPVGGLLAFEVDPRPFRYVALLARGGDGRTVWYFPAAEARSLSVDGHAALLRRGVRLGESQPPGRYEILLMSSREPLTRAEIKAMLGAESSDASRVRVARQTFDVRAAP